MPTSGAGNGKEGTLSAKKETRFGILVIDGKQMKKLRWMDRETPPKTSGSAVLVIKRHVLLSAAAAIRSL